MPVCGVMLKARHQRGRAEATAYSPAWTPKTARLRLGNASHPALTKRHACLADYLAHSAGSGGLDAVVCPVSPGENRASDFALGALQQSVAGGA